MLQEETVCGPLCQHPTCWHSARRKARNIPHRVHPLPKTKVKAPTVINSARSLPDDPDEYDLPKQSVVNMLDDFGDDPSDRYPSKFKGRPMHERSKSIMSALEIQQSYNRAQTRESFHKGRAPQATPASLHGHVKMSAPQKKATLGQVEVQEVFDFEELNRNWSDTFMAKHYYVWVPNPNKKRKPRPPADTATHVHRSYRDNVRPKDITEDLVPQEIEWIREATTQFDDVWPKIKRKFQGRSAQSPSPYSRMQAYPLSEQLTPGREPYYGESYLQDQLIQEQRIYELLDLPREVLNHVLKHINGRDMLDRQRFTQALMEALPQLEEKSTAIALAKSEVLQQRPKEILDGRLKEASRQNEFPQTQVFKLTGAPSLPADIPPSHPVAAAPPPFRDTVTGMTPRGQEVDPDQITPRRLTKLQPVPPIGGGGPSLEEVRDSKAKIPTISLGLPTIPTGVQHTKPFKYKGVEFDFSLGPVSPNEAKLMEGPVTTLETQEDKESTQRSDKDSTLHVTVPSVPSTEEETAFAIKVHIPRQATEESGAVTATTPYTQPAPPMNTPLHTPYYDGHSESPSPTKTGPRGGRELSFPSPLGYHPHPPVNTPQGPPVTEFTAPDLQASSTLDPIRESEQADQALEDQGPPPRSGKSVRFAPDLVAATPSVPPSSPEVPEKQEVVDMSEVTTVKTVEGSLSVHAHTTAGAEQHQQEAGAVSSRKSEEQSAPPSAGVSKQSSALSVSPEPWPQIDEAQYDVSPSPPPPKSAIPPTPQHEAQSMAVNLDSQETTPASSTLPPLSTHTQSRESSRAMLRSRESLTGHMNGSKAVDDSPAPPPPSPEPKEGGGLVKENTGLSQLEDILETESELTISARPPSNLDDESAVPTPIISAKVTRKMNNGKPPQHVGKLGKEKSGDSLRRAVATSGVVKENTTTTIPSDSITVASEGANSRIQQDVPSEDFHHQWNPKDASLFRQSALILNPSPPDPLQAVSQANTSELSSDLFVTGTKLDVAGKSGRGLNIGRPDETRKRAVENTPRGQAVAKETQDKEGQMRSSLEDPPKYVQRDDMDTFDSTEKQFQDELKLAYRQLSDLQGSEPAEKP